MAELPKVVYVVWEENDDPFLFASASFQALAEHEAERDVGVYHLKDVRRLVNRTELIEAPQE